LPRRFAPRNDEWFDISLIQLICYKIYTNTSGDETPIRGTEPLCAPLAQMTAAAEHAGTFVGLRSGLCDVLFSANCRKVVVFPDCHYSTTPHKVADFFALPGWERIITASG
jgi:hypothetical protein